MLRLPRLLIILPLFIFGTYSENFAQSFSAPLLTEPPDGKQTIIFHPHFAWDPVPGAEDYQIEIAQDPDFTNLTDSDSTNAIIHWHATDKMLAPGNYFWRVRATSNSHSSPWSATRRVEIITPAQIFEITPSMSLEEIREIGRKATASSSTRIQFAPGEYRLHPGMDGAVFEWNGAENIIIDGGDANIYVDAASRLINLENCRHIMIGNLRFSHDPDPISAATLLSTDSERGTVDIQITAGFDGVVYPWPVNQFFLYAVDPENVTRKRPGAPGHTYLDREKTEDLGDGKRRFHVRAEKEKASLKGLIPGDRLVVAYRRWPQNDVRKSEDITFYNYRGAKVEGPVFMGGGNKDMKFFGLHNPSPGGIFPSAPGWVTGNDRRGPWMEDCSWEAMSDDGPNITGNTYLIHEVIASDQFRVATGPFYQNAIWQPGDELLFWNCLSGLPIKEVRVKHAIENADASITVTTDAPVNGLDPGKDRKTNTHIYNLSTQNLQLVIRNCTLTGGRRFGFNIKAIGALIEKNRFLSQSSSALYFENEPSGWEGIVNRDLVIQDNHIENVGRDEYSIRMQRANIHVNIWRNPAITESPWIGNRNILIRRNTILNRDGIGIGVDNTENVTITQNTIRNDASHSPLSDDPEFNVPIKIFSHSKNVQVFDNTVE